MADEEKGNTEALRERVRLWILVNRQYQPEPRIARDYWTTEDKLGYAPYADAVAAFIRHRATLPPLTIGIKAPWGAGKTSLMRMVQNRLDPPAMEWRCRKHPPHRQLQMIAPPRRWRRPVPMSLVCSAGEVMLGRAEPLRQVLTRPESTSRTVRC